jgi:predicted membrane protein
MRISFQLFAGLLLILWGVLLIIAEVFEISFWMLCWPTLLILLGAWLLLRPRFSAERSGVRVTPAGEFSRSGPGLVQNEEIWMFAGDIELDLRQSDIPVGETVYRLQTFASEIELRLPGGVGCSVKSSAMVTHASIQGRKVEYVFNPYEYASPGYEQAERKVRLEITSLVADLDIEQF